MGMTEAIHAKLDGLLPVYDCGKKTYIYPYKSIRYKKTKVFLKCSDK
jgi:hypothetical protein